jgi:hypothetical protein
VLVCNERIIIMTMSYFYPPKGINFGCISLIPIDMLQRDLNKIVRFLQNKYPSICLNLYHDWWQHDGLHFINGTLDWPGLFSIVKSSKTIFESMQGDDFVRIGIAPPDGTWYLRFWVDWEYRNENRLLGDYDLVVLQELLEEFQEKIQQTLEADLQESPAQEHFQEYIEYGI